MGMYFFERTGFWVVRSGRGTRLACLAACWLLAGVLACAQTTSAPASKAAGEETQKTGEKKPVLADVTRVSTERAVRSAAKEKSRQGEEKAEEEKTSDSGVTEFRPAGPVEKGTGEDQSASDDGEKSKGRVLKNVHGRVSGAADSSGTGSRTGSAVGASSSSGKTSIYVETERAREKLPRN
jgi:hypothetical protein